jgi:hypothetical protein
VESWRQALKRKGNAPGRGAIAPRSWFRATRQHRKYDRKRTTRRSGRPHQNRRALGRPKRSPPRHCGPGGLMHGHVRQVDLPGSIIPNAVSRPPIEAMRQRFGRSHLCDPLQRRSRRAATISATSGIAAWSPQICEPCPLVGPGSRRPNDWHRWPKTDCDGVVQRTDADLGEVDHDLPSRASRMERRTPTERTP